MVKSRLKYATPRVLPLGYRYAPDRGIEVDPVTGPLVREAFQLAADGASIRTVIKMLSSKGLKSNRGKEMSPSSMFKILQNLNYLGLGASESTNSVEAITSRDIFISAQYKLIKKRKNKPVIKPESNHMI